MSLFKTETDLLIFMHKYRTKEDIEKGLLQKIEELKENDKFYKSIGIEFRDKAELIKIEDYLNNKED